MSASESPPESAPRDTPGPWIAGILGAFAALLLVGFWIVWQTRSPWPQISAESLLAAHAKWEASPKEHYRLRLRIVGPLPSEMVIAVRGGEPVEVVRDGLPVRQSRVWSSWTIDGLHQMIRLDLDTLATDRKDSLRLIGEFDHESGLPRHYRRIQFDPPLETGWDIEEWTTEFSD